MSVCVCVCIERDKDREREKAGDNLSYTAAKHDSLVRQCEQKTSWCHERKVIY